MAKRLRSLKTTPELSEEALTQLERDIFVGFYSVRKLIEAVPKITDETKTCRVELSWFPSRASVSWRNSYRLDELYDFNKAGRETRDIAFVASRIIHSFIFTPCVSECGGLDAIFFTSDLDKDKRLYLMGIDDVISVFERVGNDDPNRLEWQRHPDGSETTKVS